MGATSTSFLRRLVVERGDAGWLRPAFCLEVFTIWGASGSGLVGPVREPLMSRERLNIEQTSTLVREGSCVDRIFENPAGGVADPGVPGPGSLRRPGKSAEANG